MIITIMVRYGLWLFLLRLAMFPESGRAVPEFENFVLLRTIQLKAQLIQPGEIPWKLQDW